MIQRLAFGVSAAALLAAASIPPLQSIDASQGPHMGLDVDDIGGVVTSARGPEAGVWVIAETHELPTKFGKIVVTDDGGRYVLPDLPTATYRVWVRGYGLADSAPVTATPGRPLDLRAVVAPNPGAAAEIYPSNYWYALLEVPGEHEFPGTGAEGNGISPNMRSQAQWISHLKTGVVGCEACHQIGNKATRTMPPTLGHIGSSIEAWDRRVKSGQDGPQMSSLLDAFGRRRALQQFADWTDRIAAGEYPRDAPPRPAGVERNVVLTFWDWSTPTTYVHDSVSTDKRNPTVNANGPIYGPAEVSADHISALDPTTFKSWQIPVPAAPQLSFVTAQKLQYPWVHFGDRILWQGRTSPHTSAVDGRGRVWTAARVREPETPAFCREGSSHPSATHFPVARSGRQAVVYDPKTDATTPIDICAPSHHLQFAEDANDTLWFSSGIGASDVIGWLNTKTFDQTRDAAASQGWTPLILDTNGNGRQDTWVEPDQPIDATKDKRIRGAFYSIVSSPIDGAIWGSSVTFPGGIMRLLPGANPPQTTLVEFYEAPWQNPRAAVQGFTPRGVDIDRNGVVWTNLGGSGHLASFDRRRCTVLNGPTATGQHCPEGWTLHPVPGPSFRGARAGIGNADASYFNWVDQFDTFGLGRNVPMLAGNGSDAILALLPETRTWITLRVPYPLGFYSKGFDGRIDDPKAGWKGRGLWATHNERTHWHIEGGPGTHGKVIKFQLRPDPLAH